VDGGRFSGAVRPEKAVDLARLDAQVDPLDGLDVLELADEPARFDAQFRRHGTRLPPESRLQ